MEPLLGFLTIFFIGLLSLIGLFMISIKEKLEVMVEHTKLYEELLPHKNFAVMKKHFKAYASGFDGAKELRVKLMDVDSAKKVEEITKQFLSTI